MELASSAYGKVVYVSGSDVYSNEKVISAVPSSGYSFLHWHGDVSGSTVDANPLSVHFNHKTTYKDVVAVFVQNKTYALIATPSSYGKILVIDSLAYPHVKTVEAIPDIGKNFVKWIGDPYYINGSNEKTNPLTIEMVPDKNVSYIEAVFEDDIETTVMLDSSGKTIFRANIVGSLTPDNIGRLHPDTLVDSQINYVAVGSTVTSIARKCFMNCINLEHVLLRSPLQSIGEYAFYNTSLRDFDFSQLNFSNVGQYAFSCTKLHNVALAFHYSQNISDNCFRGNDELSALSVSTSTASIYISFGSMSFAECPHLSSIDFRQYTSPLPEIQANTFDSVDAIHDRKIWLRSTSYTQYAYNNPTWSLFYEDIRPQLASDNLFKMDVYQGLKVTFNAKRDSSYSNIMVKFGDSSVSSYSNAYAIISHVYSSTNPQVNVIVDNSISALNMRACTTLTAVAALAPNLKLLTQHAFTGTSLKRISIPQTVDKIESPMMQLDAYQSIPRASVEGGHVISSNWAVLNNGDLVNLFCRDMLQFDASWCSDLKHIPINSFCGCPSLTSLRFPSSIEKIDPPLVEFSNTMHILEIAVIAGGAFSVVNGILVSNDGKVYLAQQSAGNVPTGATEIMTGAFINTLVTSIACPSSVSRINQSAFWCNAQLTSISVPGIASSTANAQLSGEPWIYGGPLMQKVGEDDKKRVSQIQIACSDGILEYMAVTDENGYLVKSLDPSKVKCLTISLEYAGSSHPLPGMSNDSTRVATMIDGFYSSIETLVDSSATISNVKSRISTLINSLDEDGLFIFHISGYSSNNEADERQYIELRNGNLYDDEIWSIFKDAKCRVLAIFCTCQSGITMSAISLEEMQKSLMLEAVEEDPEEEDPEEEEDNEIERQKSWAESAEDYFNNLDESSTANPRVCVYAPCGDGEVAYMQVGIGHCLMTSLVNNFNLNSKCDSYYSLFYNATTPHETSRLGPTGEDDPNGIHPEIYSTDAFDSSIRAFT